LVLLSQEQPKLLSLSPEWARQLRQAFRKPHQMALFCALAA